MYTHTQRWNWFRPIEPRFSAPFVAGIDGMGYDHWFRFVSGQISITAGWNVARAMNYFNDMKWRWQISIEILSSTKTIHDRSIVDWIRSTISFVSIEWINLDERISIRYEFTIACINFTWIFFNLVWTKKFQRDQPMKHSCFIRTFII